MTERNRALIYVRKSMVRHRRDEISPDRQLANCKTAADVHGWHVEESDIYQDAEGHRSGRTEDHRPAWQALKTRVALDPTVAAVIVNSLDRSSRSPKDFFNFLDTVQAHDVEIVSVTEQFDTSTAIGRAFLAILMVIASLESDLASERTVATIEYLKNLGVHWGSTPYGYTRDDDAIPQPDHNASAVVECLTYYAQGGHSYRDVANYLNGHPNGYHWKDRQGNPVPFTRYAVRSMVSNALIYAGWIPMGRSKDMQLTDDAHNLHELIRLTDAVPGLHPPLIDEDLVNQVLSARHRRLSMGIRRDTTVYLLTPLLHCHHCGQQLRGKADNRKQVPAWYCHRKGASTCVTATGLDPDVYNGSHHAPDFERKALDLLNVRIPPALIFALQNAISQRINSRPENASIFAQIETLRGRQRRLRDLYLMGEYEHDEYAVLRADLLAQVGTLERQLGGAQYSLEHTLGRIDQISKILQKGTREQQKRALALLFARIDVDLFGEIKKVVPQTWARPLFADLAAMGDQVCPQGTLIAQLVAVLSHLNAHSDSTPSEKICQTNSKES